jgi:hypothetical protein
MITINRISSNPIFVKDLDRWKKIISYDMWKSAVGIYSLYYNFICILPELFISERKKTRFTVKNVKKTQIHGIFVECILHWLNLESRQCPNIRLNMGVFYQFSGTPENLFNVKGGNSSCREYWLILCSVDWQIVFVICCHWTFFFHDNNLIHCMQLIGWHSICIC